MLDISKLRLSQPSLAGSWAELGKKSSTIVEIVEFKYNIDRMSRDTGTRDVLLWGRLKKRLKLFLVMNVE